MIDTAAYLQRIHYGGSLEPTSSTLQTLHAAHMLSVPFENLNIHQGCPILLDETSLFEKIVVQRRGGFCYELNGLFAAFLRALGFEVTLLSASVARASGGFGPEFDHLTLLVGIPGHSETYLADVGFGDSFLLPLSFVEGLEQTQNPGSYRLLQADNHWDMQQRNEQGEWEAQYRFTLQPRELADFTNMCHFHQTSPESGFTQGRVCTLATPGGRITVSDTKLIITAGKEKTERAMAEGEFQQALQEYFGIVL